MNDNLLLISINLYGVSLLGILMVEHRRDEYLPLHIGVIHLHDSIFSQFQQRSYPIPAKRHIEGALHLVVLLCQEIRQSVEVFINTVPFSIVDAKTQILD